jgi:hypothetical protein
MSALDNLKTKARFLRNAAPQQFSDFYEALAEYSEETADFLILATDNLQLHQGRAQQCVKFLRVLEEVKNG